MARKSLADGLKFDDKKSDKPKSSDGSGASTKQIVIVCLGFLAGGLGIAFYMGAFDRTPTKPVITVTAPEPEVQAVKEKAKAEQDRLMQLPNGHPKKPIIAGS